MLQGCVPSAAGARFHTHAASQRQLVRLAAAGWPLNPPSVLSSCRPPNAPRRHRNEAVRSFPAPPAGRGQPSGLCRRSRAPAADSRRGRRPPRACAAALWCRPRGYHHLQRGVGLGFRCALLFPLRFTAPSTLLTPTMCSHPPLTSPTPLTAPLFHAPPGLLPHPPPASVT